jgi:tetratricopeptide (TPR) repeat protein
MGDKMQKSYTVGAVILVVALFAGLVLILVSRQESTPDGETTGLDESLEAARANLDAGEYDAAIADLEAAVEADPGNSEAHFLLGQAYNKKGQLLDAADEFRTVIELNPEDAAAAHHNLGVTYLQLQDLGAAVAEFEAAIKLEPDDPDTRYQLGAAYLYLALGSEDPQQLMAQAQAEFETALELKENMPQALVGLGNIYNQRANHAAAIQVLQQAIEQAPDLPEAYYALGEAYAMSGDVAKACETYGRFMEMDALPLWKDQGRQVMTALGCP